MVLRSNETSAKGFLGTVGIMLIFVALLVDAQNFGSCPAGLPNCDHTFEGTNIWIRETAEEIGAVGIAALISSLLIMYYRKSLTTEIETNP